MSKQLKAFRDFSGGLSEVANDNMKDNQLIEARNVIPGDNYCIARAHGTEIAYQVPGGHNVALIVELKPTSGDTQLLAFTQNLDKMDMYKYTEEWESIATDLAPVLDWFIYGGALYWLDGENFKFYNGTSVADVANTYSQTTAFWSKIKTATAVEQRGQRWFFATTDNEVVFSEVGYVNKFKETSLIQLTTIGSDMVTALHEFNDGLLIFQKRRVWFVSGWDFAGGSDITLSLLNVTSGTKWPDTVKTIQNAVFFLGRDGVYKLYPYSNNTTIATKNISDTFISSRFKGDLNNAFAAVWDGVYYLTVQSDEIREYRYYIGSGAWFGEYTQGCYCYSPSLLDNDNLFIGCGNGYILKYVENSYHYVDIETGGYAGIPMFAKTKGFDISGAMVQDAKLKRAYVVVKQFAEESSALTVQIKADYADAAWNWEMDFDDSLVYAEGAWGEAYWGWKDVVTKEIKVNRKAKRLQFIIHDDSMDNPLLVYGVAVLFKKKKTKGSRDGVNKTPIVYE